MRLADFLILLLQAHAATLQRLAALFGEEELVDLLEESGDPDRTPGGGTPAPFTPNPGWFSAPDPTIVRASGSPYAALEGAVRELGLPPVLEFHLWAYPVYRAFVESEVSLDAEVVGDAAVEAALREADVWVRHLTIHPTIAPRAELAARSAWMRFRTEGLKALGIRPIGVVP